MERLEFDTSFTERGRVYFAALLPEDVSLEQIHSKSPVVSFILSTDSHSSPTWVLLGSSLSFQVDMLLFLSAIFNVDLSPPVPCLADIFENIKFIIRY